MLRPITFGSETIEELRFQPLELRAVRNLHLPFADAGGKLEWAHVMQLAEAMTGLAPAKIEKLRGPDAAELFNIVMAAWGEFLPTGSEEQRS